MIFNRTEKEEKAYLMDIIALLAANIEQMDKAIEDKIQRRNGAQNSTCGENLPNWTEPRKSAVRQIVTQQVAASESLAEKKENVIAKMMAHPPISVASTFKKKDNPKSCHYI